MPARPRKRGATRPPDVTEREGIVRSFDALSFSVRGATDLPDGAGIKWGDRVGLYLEGTCVDVTEATSREGSSERAVAIEVFDGHVLRIIDEVVGTKPAKKKRRKATVARGAGGAAPSP